MITAEDQIRLAEAIRDAESRTAGEIVVVVAQEASHYRSIPILWALLMALAIPWPLIALTALGPTRIFQVQLLVALAMSVFLSLPKRRFSLVPRFIKHARAREAAAREFLRRGLTRTRDKTGVLIYVAMGEHYAEILADAGIADRVDADLWRDIIRDLTGAIKEGRIADGLMGAVERSGAILAEHAPPRPGDEDELPNKVILL